VYPLATDHDYTNLGVDTGPLAVGVLDVDTGLLELREPTDPTALCTHVFALLRNDGWPTGVDILPLDGDSISRASHQLAPETPGSPSRGAVPTGPFSVVICTRNRPRLLARGLHAITSIVRVDDEVIVVDNAPEDDATAEVVAGFPGVRRVVEPRPGLSRARNRGLEAARHPFVVFTDDDIEPEPTWLEVIGATFGAHAGAVCVGGSVLPMSLSTPAELRFQEFGGYVPNFEEVAYHLAMEPPPSKLFPFHPRLLGTGANMAFRVEALRGIGGFDEALGAGTTARGGEDIDVVMRLLLAGHVTVRQPASVVWHSSMSTDDELVRQIEGYGCGLAATFSKYLTQRSTMPPVMRRLPTGVWTALSDNSSKNDRRTDSYPRELRLAELKGMAKGVVAYHSSRWQQRRDRIGDSP
jgi:GT2 family glycosyltransferase